MTTRSFKTLHVLLWVAQILLGLSFIFGGAMKAFQPMHELEVAMAWAEAIPVWLMRFIGISELLGGLGLIIPALFRFSPKLIPWAAAGLATVMLLAAIFHLWRGEIGAIVANAIIGSIAVFIAWGRFKKVPIRKKAVAGGPAGNVA